MAVIRDIAGEDFDETVARGRVLAEFWAPWCNPCKMMGRILEQAAVTAPPETVIAKINVEDFPGTAARFQVTTVPTFLLYENGVQTKRISGPLPMTEILTLLGA